MKLRSPLVILMLSTLTACSDVKRNSGVDISQVCGECVTPIPFQPTEAQISATNQIHHSKTIDRDGLQYEPKLIIDGVPFFRYWQFKNKNQYVFHPMAWGTHVLSNADDPVFRQKLPAVSKEIGVYLPGGGLAFYYPNHYELNRMKGPDRIYSAISQSTILSGYLKYYLKEGDTKSRQLLESVKSALFLPYERGGVNLKVAQLELPLFRSNPEIILNGWLHSLLHLSDYAHTLNDKEVAEYIRRNLIFFADNHGAWYDEKRSITRYSDTSPHNIFVKLTHDKQSFKAIFRAKSKDLISYSFAPVLDLENKYSSFDFRIINKAQKEVIMGITCSTLFHTDLISDAPFSFKIRDGGYDPRRASPGSTGKWHEINSINQDGVHMARVAIDQDELICGYPTNFSKANKKNFYHMQHIVALLYLAHDSPYDDDALNVRIREIAWGWLRRTADFPHSGYEFEDPQKVLDAINSAKVRRPITDAVQLLRRS
jgi:hypothetical protein